MNGLRYATAVASLIFAAAIAVPAGAQEEKDRNPANAHERPAGTGTAHKHKQHAAPADELTGERHGAGKKDEDAKAKAAHARAAQAARRRAAQHPATTARPTLPGGSRGNSQENPNGTLNPNFGGTYVNPTGNTR